MMTAGVGGTYCVTSIAPPAAGKCGFPTVNEQNHATYPPLYLATQIITQECVITAYPVDRPDGQWPVMLINISLGNEI
jgi:hypothetical protein